MHVEHSFNIIFDNRNRKHGVYTIDYSCKAMFGHFIYATCTDIHTCLMSKNFGSSNGTHQI